MTKTFKRIIITAITLIVLAGAACAVVVAGGCSSSAASPIDDMRNGFLNTALDASGLKSRADAEIRDRLAEAASGLGIPQSTVDGIVDSLAIEDWRVASLPAGAAEAETYTVNAEGTSARITTYDDPGIVTVDAYGQSLTMELPESAQRYVPYLQYLQYLEE